MRVLWRVEQRTDARLWGHAQPERGFVDAGGGAPAPQSTAGGGGFYAPAATASWRLRLLRTADMSDAAIASIRCARTGVASHAHDILISRMRAGVWTCWLIARSLWLPRM